MRLASSWASARPAATMDFASSLARSRISWASALASRRMASRSRAAAAWSAFAFSAAPRPSSIFAARSSMTR
jgi:hypothetical protein